jgi:hypothetical protein
MRQVLTAKPDAINARFGYPNQKGACVPKFSAVLRGVLASLV